MRYGSVCSGIEAASVAWKPLGWNAAWFSEIEPFPCAVLAHHYPDVPNLGDMTKLTENVLADHGAIDVLVGGTPCQSFSVAGLRGGLDDPRGNLALRFLQLAGFLRPRWLVWENVPGVRSSGEGRDFAAFLGGLGQLGYGWAYRSLDAQYFNLAQRRERVFVVGHFGDWRRAAAALLERDCLSGNPPPSREAKQGVAGTVTSGIGRRRGAGTDPESLTCERERESTWWDGSQTAETLDCAKLAKRQTMPDKGRFAAVLTPQGGSFDEPTHSLRADGLDASEDGAGRGTPLVPVAFSCKDHAADAGDAPPTLRAMGHDGSHANAGGQVAVAWMLHSENSTASQNGVGPKVADRARSLDTNGGYSHGQGGNLVQQGPRMAVRRLTPRECERLMGFPDDYTLVPYRGKPAKDGPRYKVIGNSMAVPVMAWIGRRIAAVSLIEANQ